MRPATYGERMGDSITGTTAAPASARARGVARTAAPEPLWREALGARLRRMRREQELTLDELADRAGLSPQYLSEIERGRKEPSSEMIAAVAGALGLGLLELTTEVADELRRGRRGVLGFLPSSAAREARLAEDDSAVHAPADSGADSVRPLDPTAPRSPAEAVLIEPPLGVAA